ncbi:hypothetical protein BCD64_02600 [Nostoc sp. MBR 210]|nr:hypothetical protein BCD64_02600 [Nostoc sp. MBR 210]
MLSEDEKWYRVRLRLVGDNLSIKEIEVKLGLKTSRRLRDKNSTHYWISESLTDSDVSFEEQITLMLNILEPRIKALKEILSLPSIEGDLFLGFSSGNGQGGAFLSTELLRRIADCGLALTLDLYPPTVDETDISYE